MSTQNICFNGKISKIILYLSLTMLLICPIGWAIIIASVLLEASFLY